MIYIVVISAEYINAREVCEFIENSSFSSLVDLRAVLNKGLEVDEEDVDIEQPQMFTLTDFMDEVNDDCFNSTECFISYCNINGNK